MKFLVMSDIHYISINPPSEVDGIIRNVKDLDYDCALLAGDIGVTDGEINQFLTTYLKNKKACFLGGNHITYLPHNTKTLPEINQHLKEKFPLTNDWSFMENDYKIIGDTVVIGCNLYTDYKYHSYKEFHTMLDDKGRRLDQKGNLLPENPTDTEEFKNKSKEIWGMNLTWDEKNKLFDELYRSITPAHNERVDTSFKERVSEEVYDNYINWLNSVGKEGKKEYTQKEYVDLNKRLAYRNMNDFRYGKMPDSDPLFSGFRYMNPDDYEKFHKESLKYIDKIYKQFENTDYKIVVMTHHCPSTKCISPVYYDSDLNASFVSDLDKWILKHPKIKLWVCGHVHSPVETFIGDTKIVCNPMGYIPYKEHLNFKPTIITI